MASLAACTKSASYDERMEYLRTVAQRGADTHALIKSQEATIDKERCERAYEGLNDNDVPAVLNADNREGWLTQIKEFFVDSCISGKPSQSQETQYRARAAAQLLHRRPPPRLPQHPIGVRDRYWARPWGHTWCGTTGH